MALDAARFVGTMAIVWLHTMAINPAYEWLANLGGFAVPFFTLTAVVLMGESVRRSPGKGHFSNMCQLVSGDSTSHSSHGRSSMCCS